MEELKALVDAAATEETWTYAGVRDDGANGLFHAWVDELGVERFYQKCPRTFVGARHAVSATRDGDSCRAAFGRLVSGYRAADKDRVAGWNMEHEAARTAHAARNAAKTHNKLDEATIKDLRARLRRMPAPARRALIAVVPDRLMGGGT